MAERLRNVVRAPGFDEEFASIIGSIEAADEFMMAAEILLSRDPLIGSPTHDPLVWALPMAPVHDRDVWLFYRFDDREVELIALAAF
ncbi:MAG: hypothetical protein ACO1QR_14640 [Chthoniobacteraceae bacterium]